MTRGPQPSVSLFVILSAAKNPRISLPLDAPRPPRRRHGHLVACQPILEDAILPQPEDLYKAMLELAKY